MVAGFSFSTMLLGVFIGVCITMGTLLALPAMGVKLPKFARMLNPGGGTPGGAGLPEDSGR